ncbi:MAG: ATP-binding cassette domain-containing protein [Bacteroidetes bacterium]|nr:ATP-binding cassette domain-containing protein [Bacteroidota bacterium]
MKITLIDAGKRFNRDWIFRHLNYEFSTGHSYAITGSNGSGKSTLLQAIAGAIGLSQGSIAYDQCDPDQAYQKLALCAPYLEVIEEMTVTEFLSFHSGFKPFMPNLSIPDIIRSVGLEAAAQKQIRYYSSGMKQRVRLAQALFSDTPILLLDEPCTNLDADGIALYRRLTAEYSKDRVLLISSNDPQEYDFCEKTISIMEYKS